VIKISFQTSTTDSDDEREMKSALKKSDLSLSIFHTAKTQCDNGTTKIPNRQTEELQKENTIIPSQ
jgi:hypothetical protein